METGCRCLQPYYEAFVDGELSAERTLEIEQHLANCELCDEHVRVSRALQRSMRQVVMDDCVVSRAFEERIKRSLCAERRRERSAALEASGLTHRRSRPLPWKAVVPLAAAAALTLMFAGAKNGGERKLAGMNVMPQAPASELDPEELIEQLIQRHASEPTPELTEANSVLQLERRVGLPVIPLEPAMNQYGARWVGGSIVPVDNHRAASLSYRLAGHRVTVYVYDADRLPLRRTRMLEPRVVRDRPVFVGTRRGYSIAAMEQRGVGYAVATDLDTEESAELVAAIR